MSKTFRRSMFCQTIFMPVTLRMGNTTWKSVIRITYSSWLWLIYFCLACGGTLRLEAETRYELNGVIVYQAYIADVPKTKIEKKFKVSVDGCNWLIRTADLGD